MYLPAMKSEVTRESGHVPDVAFSYCSLTWLLDESKSSK